MHVEYAQYIDEPITSYRKTIFDKLIRQISGGSVCDLGSHAIGHYWALGYAERVDEYSLYDISKEALLLQQQIYDNISPGFLEEAYADTLDFLHSEGLAQDNTVLHAYELQDKLEDITRFDFLQDIPERQFNWVIAIESLEIVENLDELYQSFRTAKQLLIPENGTLLAVVLPYEDHDDGVACLCQAGLEGLLNPSSKMVHDVLAETGFTSVNIDNVQTNMRNYSHAHFITACV